MTVQPTFQSDVPVQPGAPATTQQSQALLALAAQYAAEQQQARAELITAVLAIWAAISMKDVMKSWAAIGTRIFVLISIMQELVARDANQYVRDVLALQGLTYDGPDIDPLQFAGLASDGRSLESLLAGAPIQALEAQRGGLSDDQARERGANWLRLVINTQIPDAARAAESVSLTVADPHTIVPPDAPPEEKPKPVVLGWIRLLTPPSCGRCTILAGRWYRWSDGFERHPNCDCRHVPVAEAGADDLLSNPYIYFNSLTEEEQNYYFGAGPAEAIRNGGDINQVINAATRGNSMYTADDGKRYTREGTGRKGFYGNRANKVRRPTPQQIYKDSKGNKAKAIAMLEQFGYIIAPAAAA